MHRINTFMKHLTKFLVCFVDSSLRSKNQGQNFLWGTITIDFARNDTVTFNLSLNLIFELPFYLIQPPIFQIPFISNNMLLKKMETLSHLLYFLISRVMRISYSLKFIDQDDMQTFFFLVHFQSKSKKGERISVQVEQIYWNWIFCSKIIVFLALVVVVLLNEVNKFKEIACRMRVVFIDRRISLNLCGTPK